MTSRVLLAPAGGPLVGGGHVIRTLALAEALEARGASCAFACEAEGAALLRRRRPHVDVQELERSLGDAPEALDLVNFSALVIDDYRTGAREEARWRAGGMVVMALDDLADRAHSCDVLIDSGYGRTASDYAGRLPPGALLRLGPGYALLRSGFPAGRPEALARAAGGQLDRLFVSFGLSDVEAIALRAYRLIRSALPGACIDLALGAAARSLPPLLALGADDPRLQLHVDAPELSALMLRADAAVGAGGGGLWERACLGLPSIAVIVAENQRSTVEALSKDGAVLGVDLLGGEFEPSLRAALEGLKSPGGRARLSRLSAGLCDGEGAGRSADLLLERLAQRNRVGPPARA